MTGNKIGFSNKMLPKKISSKISDNLGQNPYGTPSKMSQGHIGKSFEFSGSDSHAMDESQDKVEQLPVA